MKQQAGIIGALLLMALCGERAAAQPPTPQAVYDKAQADYDAGHWADAAAGFGSLLPGEAGGPLKRFQAVIAYRSADALMHLGRMDEAKTWIDQAAPVLAHDPDLRVAADAYYVQATIERVSRRYAAAVEAYEAADRLLSPTGYSTLLLQVRMGLAFADVTHDPARVFAGLQSLAAAPEFRTEPAATRAVVEDLEARAALNKGDLVAAKSLAARAIADGGGLSDKVTLSQVAARADAGIIAHLLKDSRAEQEFFTYTGAGHIDDLGWVAEHAGDPPICGEGEGAIHPDDFAIVTIEIADDGRVVGATPIFASRGGDVGWAFARAAGGWSWNPGALQKVNGFWRSSLQLELRCATRPPAWDLERASARDVVDWLKSRNLVTAAEDRFTSQGGRFDVARSDPRLGRPAGAVLAAAAAPLPQTPAGLQKLWTQLDAAKAPSSAYAVLLDRYARDQMDDDGDFARRSARAAKFLEPWLPKLRQQFPTDRWAAGVALNEALLLQDSGQYAQAEPYLKSVVEAAPIGDPLRAIALLHLAISLDHARQPAAARASLEQSGLDDSQCSLIETYPLPQNMRIGSETFPTEAVRWGFEGYVNTAFDITDDGHVKDVRALISYPPFIFEDATDKAVARFQFEPPRLGGKVVGCSGQQQAVRYRIGR